MRVVLLHSVCLVVMLWAPFVSAEHSGQSVKLLETIVVTATREENSLANTAASVGIFSEKTIEAVNPGHSSELLNRIPGVNIVQLGSSGEGTAAAIRQPVSYSPVYLYLENGVPTRSSAFFNHNALYEMNVSAANGVEVIKGPGSALYGSDAIGAVSNLLSGQPPKEERLSVGLESGDDGWLRAQLRAATITENHGFTARLDISESDGWREHTESERQSFTGSWNTTLANDWRVNTVLTASNLDYNTGGSGLSFDDYQANPKQFGNLIGYRKVSAFRLSSAFDKTLDNGSLTITPLLRSNDLDYIAHWTLRRTDASSPDAHINESGHDSLGLLVKYRHNLSDSTYLIAGVDFDASEGDVTQIDIDRTDANEGIDSYWQNYEKVGLFYDYSVDFFSYSPYLH